MAVELAEEERKGENDGDWAQHSIRNVLSSKRSSNAMEWRALARLACSPHSLGEQVFKVEVSILSFGRRDMIDPNKLRVG